MNASVTLGTRFAVGLMSQLVSLKNILFEGRNLRGGLSNKNCVSRIKIPFALCNWILAVSL
jgi:hypothetical protein